MPSSNKPTWHEGDRALYGLSHDQAAYHRGPWTQHGVMICREPVGDVASYQNHFPTDEMAAAVCRFLNQWEAGRAD